MNTPESTGGNPKENSPASKPTRARYVVLLLLFVVTMINYLDRTNMAIAAPSMLSEFGFDATTMGILFSAIGWTYAVRNDLE